MRQINGTSPIFVPAVVDEGGVVSTKKVEDPTKKVNELPAVTVAKKSKHHLPLTHLSVLRSHMMRMMKQFVLL
jgi:hypothetical protein